MKGGKTPSKSVFQPFFPVFLADLIHNIQQVRDHALFF
jgi:hypothetical protein